MKWADVHLCLFYDVVSRACRTTSTAFTRLLVLKCPKFTRIVWHNLLSVISQINHANELKTMIVRLAHLTVQLLVRGDEIWEDSRQFP